MASPRKGDGEADLMLMLASAMGGGNPIEEQEARGQQELNTPNAPVGEGKAVTLPTEVNPVGASGGERELLLSWGFELGEPHGHDPIFCDAKLPVGWDMKPSDHSMWSYVYDDEGRERLSIFYKAAFYDRRAFMNVNGRFDLSKDYLGEGDDKYKFTSPIRLTVTDKETGEIQVLEGPRKETEERMEVLCKGLVPDGDWRNPKHWPTQIKTAWERIGSL